MRVIISSRGGVLMTRKENDALLKVMNELLNKLEPLSPDEIKKETHELFYNAGIVDENDEITEPYKMVFVQ